MIRNHPRTRSRTRAGAAFLAAGIVTTGLVAPFAAAPAGAVTTYATQLTVRATDSNGDEYAEGTGNGVISRNGQWIAFTRSGTNEGYVKSLLSGEVSLVTLNDADQPANASTTTEGISETGRYVLFATAASNMAQGTKTNRDLYVRDRQTNKTWRANLSGIGAPLLSSGTAALSDDGSTVAFTSGSHVYARSVFTGFTQQVDQSTASVSGNLMASEPDVSRDGRYVSFTSTSTNLVAGDSNLAADVFLRDRTAGTTTRVSVTAAGAQSGPASTASSVSDDGTRVAFQTDGVLVAGDTNATTDVYIRDLTVPTTFRGSLGTNGVQALGSSTKGDLSGSGTQVAFQSQAENIESPANGYTDVFRRSISTGITTRQGGPSAGPNRSGLNPQIASDTTAVLFSSAATNLVGPDGNSASDVFVDRYEEFGIFPGTSTMVTYVHRGFAVPASADAAVLARVNQGRLPVPHLLVRSARADAFAKDRAPIARLYQAFFHRVPDLNGLNYWVKKRSQGTKLSKVAASFAGSNEFKTAYGTVSHGAFLTLVYQNVLDRDPDDAGLQYWVTKMEDGLSRGDVMVAFSESNEGKRRLAPEVDATLMGLGMLKKMPSSTLWQAMAAAAKTHGLPEHGALVLLRSAELDAARFS